MENNYKIRITLESPQVKGKKEELFINLDKKPTSFNAIAFEGYHKCSGETFPISSEITSSDYNRVEFKGQTEPAKQGHSDKADSRNGTITVQLEDSQGNRCPAASIKIPFVKGTPAPKEFRFQLNYREEDNMKIKSGFEEYRYNLPKLDNHLYSLFRGKGSVKKDYESFYEINKKEPAKQGKTAESEMKYTNHGSKDRQPKIPPVLNIVKPEQKGLTKAW